MAITTGQQVRYFPAGWSERKFHGRPDAGATFPDPDTNSIGGWIYTSNSEIDFQQDGVGALNFDKDGNVLDQRMVLQNSSMNGGGGRTPWSILLTCEEIEFNGIFYQVDPTGERDAQVLTLGSDGGRWESFAYDVRSQDKPRFFATEDHSKGTVRRFTPHFANWQDPWNILHRNGTRDFLMIFPDKTLNEGTYIWTNDKRAEREQCQAVLSDDRKGIDVYENQMFFVCKKMKIMFVLDLNGNTYYNRTTKNGLFDGKLDSIDHILGDPRGMLYFTEKDGVDSGVHAPLTWSLVVLYYI